MPPAWLRRAVIAITPLMRRWWPRRRYWMFVAVLVFAVLVLVFAVLVLVFAVLVRFMATMFRLGHVFISFRLVRTSA